MPCVRIRWRTSKPPSPYTSADATPAAAVRQSAFGEAGSGCSLPQPIASAIPSARRRDRAARRALVRVGVIQLVRVGQQGRIDLHVRFLRAAAFAAVAAGFGDVVERVPVVHDLAVGHLQHGRDVGPLGLQRRERVVARERGGQRQQRGIDVQAKVLRIAHVHRGGPAAAPHGQQGGGEGGG